MVRISIGIRDIDDFIAARGETPPDATNVDDVELRSILPLYSEGAAN
jgi:hypothetical protein